MEMIVERCCGLDVHQATVVACLLVGRAAQKPKRVIKTFRTVTRDLIAMRDWLRQEGCTHVAMESTGVYWMPVYGVLESSFDITVGNAQHMRNVPGRKTDVKDSEWIAELLRLGLIAKSFVPSKALRQLRDLLRYRRKLVESRTSERNRLLRVLETANVKLASVASDVFGASGKLMVEALIEGRKTPEEVAGLAKGRLRAKLQELQLALESCVEEHHRFLLRMQLKRLEAVDADIATLDERIEEKLTPYRTEHGLLMTIPGVDWCTAAVIIAEVGVDMRVFKSDKHLSAWAGVCPGNNESAGKARKAPARRGNVHLKTALVGAAVCASKTNGTYLKDKYFRLKARRGALRAAVAIGNKILIAAYHILASGKPYNDLTDAYLDRADANRTRDNLVRRLVRLGFDVQLLPKAA